MPCFSDYGHEKQELHRLLFRSLLLFGLFHLIARQNLDIFPTELVGAETVLGIFGTAGAAAGATVGAAAFGVAGVAAGAAGAAGAEPPMVGPDELGVGPPGTPPPPPLIIPAIPLMTAGAAAAKSMGRNFLNARGF